MTPGRSYKHNLYVCLEVNRLGLYFYYSNNISLSALAFGSRKDAQVYGSQEGGVVGLNFHQSREALVHESNGSIYRVSCCFLFYTRQPLDKTRGITGVLGAVIGFA